MNALYAHRSVVSCSIALSGLTDTHSIAKGSY